MDNNNISDIGALEGLTNLRVISLGGNPVGAGQIARLREALPDSEIVE
jgi:Leucine-rich repeat (LRR) protein